MQEKAKTRTQHLQGDDFLKSLLLPPSCCAAVCEQEGLALSSEFRWWLSLSPCRVRRLAAGETGLTPRWQQTIPQIF